MKLWRRPGRTGPRGAPQESISLEDLAWRIGASDERPVLPPSEAERAAPRPPTKPVVSRGTRRIVLWRDVSALLFGVVAIVLIAQLGLGGGTPTADATPTGEPAPAASDVAVGATLTPEPTTGSTIGPVIDPSLITGIEATPTPLPVITPVPATSSPTHRATLRPTPRPTPRPTATPRPTPTPTHAATPSPSPSPTPTPTPPPPPPPPSAAILTFDCSPSSDVVPFTVNCNATGQDVTGWSWTLDGADVGNGSSISATIDTEGAHSIRVVAFGPGGQDSRIATITGVAPTPAPT